MVYHRCDECKRAWHEETALQFLSCPFCGTSKEGWRKNGKTGLPSEKQVLKHVEEAKVVTNNQMFHEKFGDVGIGWDTVGKLRKLADEGKISLMVSHKIPTDTVITWSSKG